MTGAAITRTQASVAKKSARRNAVMVNPSEHPRLSRSSVLRPEPDLGLFSSA
jgi:hypothetical protein